MTKTTMAQAPHTTISSAISVVIPTFNGRRLLEKHLPAVIASMKSSDELIVVDDASNDDTVEWLRAMFELGSESQLSSNLPGSWPELDENNTEIYVGTHRATRSELSAEITIMLVVLKENMRFAAAANAGVQLAQHNYIFLLNNDVSPQSGVRDSLLQHFANPSVFAVGCLEYEGDTRKSGKNTLWFAQGLYQHSGVSTEDLVLGETGWVSGGSGMFDREKWLELGGFDRRFYPAYWEDVDLSFRARKKNWLVLFDPEAVVHHRHETTNATTFGRQAIQKTSWHHADLFTWIHGSWLQRLQFLIWHLVWLWRRWRN
jgi:GT2 family glycosyltransferase